MVRPLRPLRAPVKSGRSSSKTPIDAKVGPPQWGRGMTSEHSRSFASMSGKNPVRCLRSRDCGLSEATYNSALFRSFRRRAGCALRPQRGHLQLCPLQIFSEARGLRVAASARPPTTILWDLRFEIIRHLRITPLMPVDGGRSFGFRSLFYFATKNAKITGSEARGAHREVRRAPFA